MPAVCWFAAALLFAIGCRATRGCGGCVLQRLLLLSAANAHTQNQLGQPEHGTMRRSERGVPALTAIHGTPCPLHSSVCGWGWKQKINHQIRGLDVYMPRAPTAVSRSFKSLAQRWIGGRASNPVDTVKDCTKRLHHSHWHLDGMTVYGFEQEQAYAAVDWLCSHRI